MWQRADLEEVEREADELAMQCLYLARESRAVSPHGCAAVLDIVQEISDVERFDRLIEG